METWMAEPTVDLQIGTWQVCGDCRRAYRRGEHRAVWVFHEDAAEEELVELCPYRDCEAQPRFDRVDWVALAHAHPDCLPHLPQRDTQYSW